MDKNILWFAAILAVCPCLLTHAGSESIVTERKMKFAATTVEQAAAWQKASRSRLTEFLRLDDLIEANEPDSHGQPGLPLSPNVLATAEEAKYARYDIEISSTKTRRIRVVLTVPRPLSSRSPAVVCIHGHGGDRNIVYEDASPYRGFARVLAENGYVTISTDVGQHKVYEDGRTLMGERLWDLIRCVDYVATRDEVDAERIACAGLSLGGEMAMWLGAMDTRIKATVSSGFLTTVENMRQGHCPCWDFRGFTENFDFADIYCLIAPRYLQCQNGKLERAPGGFPVSIAENAMAEIATSYSVFGKPERANLAVHSAGHVFDVPSAMKLFETVLKETSI